MFKKLISHSLLYSLAPQVPRILSFFLMPIMTKYLTASDYGIYGIITSYLFFITVWKDLGFGVVFVNTFYKHIHRWKVIWRLLYGHLIIWTIAYSGLLLMVLYIALPKSEMHNFWLISGLLIASTMIFENTNMIANYYFRFSELPRYVVIVSVISSFVAIFVAFFSSVYLKAGYLSWFYSTFWAAFVAFLINGYFVLIKLKLTPIIKFRKSFIIPHLRVALPMIPHNYSSYLLNSSDRVILDLYKVDINRIGVYNIAYQFGNMFESFGEAVGMAVGPFYSKLYSSNTEKSLKDERSLTFILMTLFLSGTFILSVWLKELFYLLVKNDKLRSGYGIGIIILMGYSYRPMYWSAGIKLSIYEKTGYLWRISLVAGICNVILNVIFVPIFGIYAAAINTFLSLLYLGFSGYYLKQNKRPNDVKHFPEYWILAICILSIFAYMLKDQAITVKVMITIVVSIILFILYKKYKDIIHAVEI
jgi:O-antigen/teichoic acid export membrane protein